jgi:quercetin dioxygenase-like cupin family protein
MAIQVFHRDEATTMLSFVARDARLVVWPGTGAWDANMNYVLMESGEANVPHDHPVSEDTIFILSGEGTIQDLTNGVDHPFHAGQAIHVGVGVRHCVKADRGVNVASVGGPCPADVRGLRAAGLLGDDDEPPPRP